MGLKANLAREDLLRFIDQDIETESLGLRCPNCGSTSCLGHCENVEGPETEADPFA